MKLTRWIIAIILILLPIVGRMLWYYQGSYQRETPVGTPDYKGLSITEPQLSTPMPPTLPPIGGDAPLVIVDMAHGNSFTLSEMDPLINALRAAGAEVVIDDGYAIYLTDTLKKADAYLVLLPTSPFDSFTIREVQRFVERGGRLLVAVDPTRLYGYYSSSSSTEIANLLLAPYNLAFNADYAYNLVKNESNFRHLILDDFTPTQLTDGLKEVVFYSAQSISQSPTPLIRGDKNTLSSLDDKGGALALAAASQDGSVVAIGDVTFMTVPYIQVADNQLLMRNLVTFLLSNNSQRTHDLEDYPYLFYHDIVIIAGEKFELDQNKFTLFSDLQAKLRGEGLEVRFGDQAVPGQDAIYFSTMPPTDPTISALVANLGITFAEDTGEDNLASNDPFPVPTTTPEIEPTPDYTYTWEESTPEPTYKITVPGVGKLSSAEFGILIYLPGAIQNRLFILGTNEDAILELAQRLIGDGLYGCAIMQNFAVCPITPSTDAGGLDDPGYDYYDYDFNGFPTEPAMTPEPTPAG